MNAKQVSVVLVLVAFSALSVVPVYHYGYVGTFRLSLANSATIQVSTDLVIALTLVLIWMWQDSREREIPFVPYLLITVFAGSFGPLLYLLRRLGRPDPLVSRKTASA